MRLPMECPECRRQYDATRRKIGSRFRCHCGQVVTVERPEGHDARVVRCSACGAARAEGADHCAYCQVQLTLHERDLNTVCPHCLARVSDHGRYCHQCGTGLTPESEAGTDTKHDCPACGAGHHLHSRHLAKENVAVLECGRCAGFWLGQEAFRQLIERTQQHVLPAATLLEQPRTTAAKVGLPVESVTQESHERGWNYRPCAICGELMVRRNYGGDSGVIIHTCREHGIWYDADELARILAWVRAGGKERVLKERPMDEYFRDPSLDEQFLPPRRSFWQVIAESLFGSRDRLWP